MNKATATFLHFIPAGMLALALARWPYGYYMLLRVVVFAAALLLAGLIYQQAKTFTLWVGLFVVVAIIFNPIVPLHLTRGVWSILNVVAAGLFVGHFVVGRLVVTLLVLAVVGSLAAGHARAEVVNVKYRSPVDLKPFTCTYTVSSFVHRVCYDEPNTYMLILLKKTWYHYCEIDAATVADLLGAESKGRYYNENIKGRFDCRTRRIPSY